MREELRRTAARAFGWERLRAGQLEAMEAVLSGADTLVVMPTGAGKSAVYQVPALLLDGPTVVISPLIALQRDQVTMLAARAGAGGAVHANSSLSERARADAFERLRAGDVEFFFLAPEQLAKPDVLAAVAAAKPSLIVVDEAHCISSWGHDFRPDYLRLGAAISHLGRPRVLALTATASPPVRDEIVSRLGLRDPVQVVHGFDRPNLRLSVETYREEQQQREAVVFRAMGETKPGIVYTATRRSAEGLAAELQDYGLAAASYHAGMRAADRESVQDGFLGGSLEVVVATTAFGMGIDKPDVRFVLHAEVADSLDSYYQEIGRAGRDGAPAEAVLFYRPEDLGLRKFFAASAPSSDALLRVVTLLSHVDRPVSSVELADLMGITTTRLAGLVNLLEQAGAVSVLTDGSLSVVANGPGPAEAALIATELAESYKRVERSRIEMMRGYAETTGCRRQYLLAYFGEAYEEQCGNCDACAAGTASEQPDAVDSPYPLQSRVSHASWGEGVVMRFEGDRIVVLFEDVGYRTLSLETVLARGLLKSA